MELCTEPMLLLITRCLVVFVMSIGIFLRVSSHVIFRVVEKYFKRNSEHILLGHIA